LEKKKRRFILCQSSEEGTSGCSNQKEGSAGESPPSAEKNKGKREQSCWLVEGKRGVIRRSVTRGTMRCSDGGERGKESGGRGDVFYEGWLPRPGSPWK